MKLKLCKKCKIEQPLTEFYKNKSFKDGHNFICKKCCLLWQRNNKDKTRQYQLRYRAKNKEKIKKQREVYNKEYNNKNKDKIRQKQRELYRIKHPKVYFVLRKGKLVMRSKALERDNHKCQTCGAKTNIVCYIDGNDKNNELMNLKTTCRKCFCLLEFKKHGIKNFSNGACKKQPDRDKKIIKLSATKSQSEISRMFSLSRQRIHQIISRHALEAKKVKSNSPQTSSSV